MTQELVANIRFGGVKRPARVTDVLSAEEGPESESVEEIARADEPGHGTEAEVGPRREVGRDRRQLRDGRAGVAAVLHHELH